MTGDQTIPGDDIVVVPPMPEWPRLFETEARNIQGKLGALALRIEHVGSTSVPGLSAKPVIDMALVLPATPPPLVVLAGMEELGYETRGENGIPGRCFFRKRDGGVRTHHVHAFPPGHSELADLMAFRDWLRSHADDARAYESLKLGLAARFRHDRGAYVNGKEAFVRSVLRRAR